MAKFIDIRGQEHEFMFHDVQFSTSLIFGQPLPIQFGRINDTYIAMNYVMLRDDYAYQMIPGNIFTAVANSRKKISKPELFLIENHMLSFYFPELKGKLETIPLYCLSDELEEKGYFELARYLRSAYNPELKADRRTIFAQSLSPGLFDFRFHLPIGLGHYSVSQNSQIRVQIEE